MRFLRLSLTESQQVVRKLSMEEEYRENIHQLEIHREILCNQIHARRLLNKMRCRSVFTKDECEEILNEVLNPSSTTKAGCFLDNLQRKGPVGYNVFLECLGEMHPNLYELLTGHEPEAPIISTTSVSSFAYAKPTCTTARVGDVIGELSQEVEDLQRELDFSNQLRLDQEREIQSLNQALKIVNGKAEKYDKVEKARKRAELKVRALESNIMTILGDSLLHKEEKDQAMESLRKKIKEVHELERRLQQAKDQAEVRRKIWQKTCMDKQQLKVDREEMLQRMSTMEEELKIAKIHEDVHKTKNSVSASENWQTDHHTQATVSILEEELKNYKEKCEDLASNLLQARNDLHRCDTELEKCKSENEELKQKELNAKKMAEIFKIQYNITWQDLNRVKQQRNRAIEERDMAQIETKAHLSRLHKHQEMMHQQLQTLQVMPCTPCQDCSSTASTQQTQTHSEIDPMPAGIKVPMNFIDALAPTHGEDLGSSCTDLLPLQRDRAYNIAPEVKITDKVRDIVYNENTFPDELFSYTPGSGNVIDEVDEVTSCLQRHHSDAFGDSRKVHPGSMKSPHLISLWDENEDEDFYEEDIEVEESEGAPAAVANIKQFNPHLHRRSKSWNNLLSGTRNLNTTGTAW